MNAARTNQCVQCDACFKWRILPVCSSELPDKWYCFMHPSKSFNCCNVPQDENLTSDVVDDISEAAGSSPTEDHYYLARPGENIVNCINSVIHKNRPKLELPDQGDETNSKESKDCEIFSQTSKKNSQNETKKRRNSSCSTLPSEPYPVVTRKKAKQEDARFKGKPEDSRDEYVQEIYQKVVDKFVSAIRDTSSPQPSSSSTVKKVPRVSCGVQVNMETAPVVDNPFNPNMVRKLLDNHVKLIEHHEKFQSNVARLLEIFFPGMEVEHGENITKTVENLLEASLVMNFQHKAP